MSTSKFSAEAKANMVVNLELELNARKDKLAAMCDAQVASLRSRLERRVNRVPSNKRSLKIVDLVNATHGTKSTVARNQPAHLHGRRAPPKSHQPDGTAAATRVLTSGEPPAHTVASKRAVSKMNATTKPSTTSRVASKSTRGTKRTSDEISGEDKENNTEPRPLPKMRIVKKAKSATASATTGTTGATGTASTATRAARTTRAASKHVNTATQVLSPKTSNSRPATRARRQR
ncbi:hypothetical protein BU24DRAFT_463936 [Aaosphaeria arxii CBS 175.79]|uniref:Borealin N-terminal domain-containing protein n=1 Tax=Aaosphaeria arxii CBS 175.79 TaxID=1450172 RepID=A0A6A5XIL1_9PLEO|nr:uncharacterized protein BU24DRAFT_463936 [Aaosphaeria arxii CBS 175.79]KAF2013115.1 hypothetical protein BU24DRAFT_463936 [Aaosphaeria arxii CBS 175.79]